MADHHIPRTNWPMHLADAIEQAREGDTIIVHNESMHQLALEAAHRMCPDKSLTFVIGEDDEPDAPAPGHGQKLELSPGHIQQRPASPWHG